MAAPSKKSAKNDTAALGSVVGLHPLSLSAVSVPSATARLKFDYCSGEVNDAFKYALVCHYIIIRNEE